MTDSSAAIALLAGVCWTGGALLLASGVVLRAPRAPRLPRARRSGGPGLSMGSLRRAALTRWGSPALAGAAVVAFLVTGQPLLIVGLPALGLMVQRRSAPDPIDLLVGLDEWVRKLSAVLRSGVGLDQAIARTAQVGPPALEPALGRMTRRLAGRVPLEESLRRLGDDWADPSGDMVVTTLVLASRRRGPGVAGVLEGLAETLREDIRVRRRVEVERARPRSTARIVTIIATLMMVGLFVNADYMAPYTQQPGQTILIVLIAAFWACLVWLDRLGRGRSIPRLVGTRASRGSVADGADAGHLDIRGAGGACAARADTNSGGARS